MSKFVNAMVGAKIPFIDSRIKNLVNQSNLRRRKYERISPSKTKSILVTNI